jgi:hypothetical protein
VPLPALLHPVTAVVQAADRGSTPYDDDAREPLRTVRRTPFSVPAQVEYAGRREPSYDIGGAAEDVEGYLVLRRIDVEAAGWTPRRGDRLVKLGWRDTSLFITQVEDAGHYADTEGASLLIAHFADRRPSADRPAQ